MQLSRHNARQIIQYHKIAVQIFVILPQYSKLAVEPNIPTYFTSLIFIK